MPRTTSTPVPPPADVVLSALAADGAAGFFDPQEQRIYAHPASVPQEQALDAIHVVIDYETADPEQPHADRGSFEATAWYPVGEPDHHQGSTTLYATGQRRPFAEEAARCAQAVIEWFANPGRTAGSVLLAALEEYGITPGNGLTVTYDPHSDTYDIPVLLGDAHGHLSVADRDGSIRHTPGAHTGWSVLLHDKDGATVGDPVYYGGTNDGTTDCTEDSAAAAALIADWLTAPVSRHCDCYSQERYGRKHDHECNRYARPARRADSGVTSQPAAPQHAIHHLADQRSAQAPRPNGTH